MLVFQSIADLSISRHALEHEGLRPTTRLADSALWPFPPATRPGRLVGAPPRPCDLRDADCIRQRQGIPICSPLLSGRFSVLLGQRGAKSSQQGLPMLRALKDTCTDMLCDFQHLLLHKHLQTPASRARPAGT